MGPEDARPIYLGVDVAGMDNTWVAALSLGDGGPGVVCGLGPQRATLEELVDYCKDKNVVAVAIDAQLTAALSEENGFRTSDMELRRMLCERRGSKNWVASINSLAGVPIRGQMLADHLSPTVGTLLETHPRASLLFALGEDAREPVWEYKRGDDREIRADHTRQLWRLWSERFRIAPHEPHDYHDGALDSLVCATVAYLYHHEPGRLYRLRHDAPEKTGRGPFYVINPETGE